MCRSGLSGHCEQMSAVGLGETETSRLTTLLALATCPAVFLLGSGG